MEATATAPIVERATRGPGRQSRYGGPTRRRRLLGGRRGRTIDLLVDTFLLLATLVVVATGILVDRHDLNEFGPHRWAGYAMAVFAGVHVLRHRRALFRFWFRRHRHPTAARVRAPLPDPVRRADGASAGEPGDERDLMALGAPGGVSRRRLMAGSAAAAVTGAVGGWFGRVAVAPPPFEGADVGEYYHRESSLGIGAMVSSLLNWGRSPGRYRPSLGTPVVSLPKPSAPDITLAETFATRRSLRSYAERPMRADELAWLVYAAVGETNGNGWRTAPSAGALFPVETYVAVRAVEGVAPGLYHVVVEDGALEIVRDRSVANDLVVAGLGQDFLREAPVVVVLTGFFQRSRFKYHERAYRYVLVEVGHVGQNLCLAAEAAGMGACVVGSFLDGQLNDLLRIDGRQEAALSIIAIGPKDRDRSTP